MDKELAFTFKYEEGDVISAQRLRAVSSARLKILAVICAVGVLFLTAVQVFPHLIRLPHSRWPVPLGAAATFLGVFLLLYLLAPHLDFRVNADWKQTFHLRLDEESLYLSCPDMAAGYAQNWRSVSKVLENERVFILIFGDELDFLILPKRLFSQEQEAFFRRMLRRGALATWKGRA